MLNIAFITTWNTNVGDDFVREGIRAVLDGICGYRPYLINKHSPELTCKEPLPEDDPYLLSDKILDADVIIQSGAPVYWNLGPHRGQKCCTAEWIEPLWYERIAQIYRSRPVLNIAAGACQGYFGTAAQIVADMDCAAFVRDVHRFCRLITVRDVIAEQVHSLLNLPVIRQPCASMFAWRRHPWLEAERRAIAVNFMPLAGHYDLEGRINHAVWSETFREIVRLLSATGEEIFLVAHDRVEFHAMQHLLPGRRIFVSDNYTDYFAVYAHCRGGLFNRIHGALLLAGGGRPSVVIANDSRSRMVDEIGLPRWHVSEVEPAVVVKSLLDMIYTERVRQHLLQMEAHSYASLKRLCIQCLTEPKHQENHSHA